MVGRYELDEGSIEFVGAWSPEGEPGFVGSRVALGGHNVATLVFEGNEPARVDRIPEDHTPATALARNWARSSAGAPINVEGRLWGVMTVGAAHEDELPPGTEYRLAQFTELVASAISNAQARGELGRRRGRAGRAAARGDAGGEAAPPSAVFASVAEEVGRLLVGRRRRGAAVSRGRRRRNRRRVELEGVRSYRSGSGVRPVRGTVTATVRETRRPARVDRYTDDGRRGLRVKSASVPRGACRSPSRASCGASIAVVSTSEEPPPPGTEERLAGFTELVATAIANAQAREELRTIADEQAALRRVARAGRGGGAAGRRSLPPWRRR